MYPRVSHYSSSIGYPRNPPFKKPVESVKVVDPPYRAKHLPLTPTDVPRAREKVGEKRIQAQPPPEPLTSHHRSRPQHRPSLHHKTPSHRETDSPLRSASHHPENCDHRGKSDLDVRERRHTDGKDRERERERRKDKESRKLVDGLEEEMLCPVCMSVMVGPHQISPCGHALCGPCGVTWLESRASAGETVNCPTCREDVNPAQPLIPARNLESMIKKYVESRGSRWDGLTDWKDREDTWAVHKQFNPTLVSPELFPPHQHRHRPSQAHSGYERRSDIEIDADRQLDGLVDMLDNAFAPFARGMPSAREYFDGGPRGRRAGSGGLGQVGWVGHGYEGGPVLFQDMDFHIPAAHLRDITFPAQRNPFRYGSGSTNNHSGSRGLLDGLRTIDAMFDSMRGDMIDLADAFMGSGRRR